MSADTSGTVDDRAPRDDRQQAAERAGGQQPSRAEAERPPAETRSRVEYNAARHAEPPIRHQSDPGQSVQADRQSPGSGTDRRAEHAATTGRAADTGAGGVRQAAEAPTRTEYNAARHAAPPIEQPSSPQASSGADNERLASGKTADAASGAREGFREGEDAGQARSGAGDETRRDRADAQYSWLSVAEADRTLGDTTPTGIGLKPTGEQLRDLGSDDPFRNRVDRVLDGVLDEAGDVRDAAGQAADAFNGFRHPDLPPSAQQAYTGHVARDHPQPPGQPANDMVGSTVVVAVAAIAGLHHWIGHRRKGHES